MITSTFWTYAVWKVQTKNKKNDFQYKLKETETSNVNSSHHYHHHNCHCNIIITTITQSCMSFTELYTVNMKMASCPARIPDSVSVVFRISVISLAHSAAIMCQESHLLLLFPLGHNSPKKDDFLSLMELRSCPSLTSGLSKCFSCSSHPSKVFCNILP